MWRSTQMSCSPEKEAAKARIPNVTLGCPNKEEALPSSTTDGATATPIPRSVSIPEKKPSQNRELVDSDTYQVEVQSTVKQARDEDVSANPR